VKKVNADANDWTCSCGKRIKLTASQIESGKEVCPHCGEPIGQVKKHHPALSPSDTQMINVSDMARMAQEGVDLAVSGEWDTSKSVRRESKNKPKKNTR
jgi:predicted RNA-binding Zn-ribbon protein involved in translation (DUF1610 family)